MTSNTVHLPLTSRPLSRPIDGRIARSRGLHEDDTELLKRIIAAYGASQRFEDDTASFWGGHYGGIKLQIHEAILRGNLEEVGSIFRDPASNALMYGFDGIYRDPASTDDMTTDNEILRGFFDQLLRLAEALGAIPLYNPAATSEQQAQFTAVDELIYRIEQKIERILSFPNPFPNEIGIETKRGIISWRPMQAVFQGWRIASLLTDPSKAHVLEIGGGLGRTAFYAMLCGVGKLTIVDLPMTGAAQAYFLGRVLGADRIQLHGEHHSADICLIPTHGFYETENLFDLAVNIDSFTEMSRFTAARYIAEIARRSTALLSINHEANLFTASELMAQEGRAVVRGFYGMRPGYVEELVRFVTPAPTNCL